MSVQLELHKRFFFFLKNSGLLDMKLDMDRELDISLILDISPI